MRSIPLADLSDKQLAQVRLRIIEKYGEPSDQLASVDREIERRAERT